MDVTIGVTKEIALSEMPVPMPMITFPKLALPKANPAKVKGRAKIPARVKIKARIKVRKEAVKEANQAAARVLNPAHRVRGAPIGQWSTAAVRRAEAGANRVV